MAVNPTQLADEIRSALSFPTPVSDQLIGWATGVLDELTQSGTATSRNFPGPHPISGMTGASMAARIVAASNGKYGFVSTSLLNYCNAVVTHIQSQGQVFYTSPIPSNPPPPSDSWFLGGTITGLDGNALAVLVAAQVGYPFVSTQLIAKCTAMVNHIMSNAEVTDGTIS